MRDKVVARESETGRRGARRWRVLLLFGLALALLCVWSAGRSRAVAPAEPAAAQEQDIDFSQFKHGTREHAQKDCAFCHQRAGDNSVRPMWNGRASLPGHKACIECHLPQFTNTQNVLMCNICHTNVENNQNPPIKDFPGLKTFQARFDHKQHDEGAARPGNRCAACHSTAGRRSSIMSIPARYDAHARCYKCHTPDAQANGRDIHSCNSCHYLGGYAPTPAAGRSFAVGFSHNTHGRRQGLDCNNCHTFTQNPRQRYQVSLPTPAQHFGSARAQTCVMCHNDQRVFGGKVVFGDKNFGNCVKCHKGTTFRL